jgi:hypothetical protein
MRRLLTFLITLALVLVTADFGLRFLSQYWVARQLQRSLDLPSRPSVSLGGFPYIPRLVSGELPTATVRTGTFSVEGVTVERVRLTLHQVHFSTRQLIYGKSADITADRGDGIAVVEALDVNATTVGSVQVRFEGGVAIVRSERLSQPFEAAVSLDGSTLTLRSTDPAFPGSFDVTLPDLVTDQRYTHLTVSGSQATIAFVLDQPRFGVKTRG